MRDICECLTRVARPVKVVQFGTGVFLRGFADWMLDIVNEKTDWNGSVAMVKSTSRGSLDALRAQNGLYSVTTRGLVDGQPKASSRGVTVLQRIIDCQSQYSDYAALAKMDSVRFIISNTTEAGIVYDDTDSIDMCPPKSYPAKLTKFLYERAVHFDYACDKGVIMLPAELITNNGVYLKKHVLHHIQAWGLSAKFLRWVNDCCVFTNTLVDRIVTGMPGDAQAIWEKQGYLDNCLVAAEPYALWVIESEHDIEAELPFAAAGLPVVYTKDITPYRARKVRLLNGAHTSFVPAAFLCGYDIVRDAVRDEDFNRFVRKALYEEIIPTVKLPKEDLHAFARDLRTRFANPYIDHKLLAICLNSISKWRERIMPTLLDAVHAHGAPPPCLAFSLAALLRLYNGTQVVNGALVCHRGDEPYLINDNLQALQYIAQNNGDVDAILSNTILWGPDLTAIPGLAAQVKHWYARIDEIGVRACIKELGA